MELRGKTPLHGFPWNPGNRLGNGRETVPGTYRVVAGIGADTREATFTVVRVDGSYLGMGRFFRKSGDHFQSPAWTELRLAFSAETGFWSVSHPSGAEWSFSDSGRIIRMARACCGMGALDALMFDYDGDGNLVRVTNPAGMFVEFSDNADHRIVSVLDSASRALSFAYDDQDRLTTFTDPTGRITLYSYGQDGFMTGITRPGARETTVEYRDRQVS
jgi:YD repeat-containing protein